MPRLMLVDSQTAGISGDMLLGALIDAGASVPTIKRTLNLIPSHFRKCKSIRLSVKETTKHGFRALEVSFEIDEEARETQATVLLETTRKIAAVADISEKARIFALGSVETLVSIESRLHGSELSHTHLHEAGSADTLADVFGVAVACDDLHVFEGEVYSTPVAVGGGKVSFSHGTVSNPAPATLEIMRAKHIPLTAGPEDTETATPTGVSMLANLVSDPERSPPTFIPERVGYGAGKRDLSSAPNVLRIVIGRTTEKNLPADVVQVLETNLDDVSGEILAHTLNRLIDSGAKDVWVSDANFKKNRPGHVLHVLCEPSVLESLAKILFEETGTLGVRYSEWNRFKLNREIRVVKLEVFGRSFDVRSKIATDGSGRIIGVKPEFDDVQRISLALSKPAREVADVLMRELWKKSEMERGEV